MIICSVVAVEAKDLLSAVISIGATGLGLSVCFLLLQSPDLAIVQLVVEILILIILIRGTVNRDGIDYRRRSWMSLIVSSIFIALFLICVYYLINELPRFGYPIMKISKTYIADGFKQTGTANTVVSILLNYRLLDTFVGVTVFFASVVGVVTVIRKIGRKK
ncbi:MAG: hydrogenase subunit MbhD domain-containing protein [Elusimicrobiota bacterium]